MTGTIALFGGGPFEANDGLDAELLGAVGADRAVVMPTADAFEHPERLIGAAMVWGERLGVAVEALMVLNRRDALDAGAAAVVQGAGAVWLVGDSPMHLRSVMKDTPVWDAIVATPRRGGLVAAVGTSAAAVCDPMTDPRGGAFTLGLGLVSGLALITEAETWSEERLHRTLSLANVPIVTLPTGAAAVRTSTGWSLRGDASVTGELPAA
jgi:cyanophycinase